MNARQWMHPAEVFIEIGQDALTAVKEAVSIEIQLERVADGRLSDGCKRDLSAKLRSFIDRKAWQPQARAYCAFGARGVSLRVLNLPRTNKDELRRLLPLQIESEFPLPPDQLAWGFEVLNRAKAGAASNGQEVLVAAVKKDLLEEYSGILAEAGAGAVFTLAALARSYLCPQPPGIYAVLHLERSYSELITIESGVPVAVRVLSWGRENLPRLAAAHDEGRNEPLLVETASSQTASFGGRSSSAIEGLNVDAVAKLAQLINGHALGRRVYVMGLDGGLADDEFPARLGAALGGAVECQRIEHPPGGAGSAAIMGLQRALERDPAGLPLALQLKQANGQARISGQAPLKWAAAAIGLALIGLLLPYAEAVVLKSHLAHKLAGIKNDQGRLEVMDRELDFLRYLKENEPLYLDAMLVLAKAAPPGTHLDSVSMNSRGEISVRGSLRDGQQVAELRSKLLNSGFLTGVAVEEQAPTPDRQKVNVRMSAQWKAAGTRPVPSLESGQSAEPGNASGPTKPASSPDRPMPPPGGFPAQITKMN